MQLIVSRRPVYDRKRQVIGYHFSAPPSPNQNATRDLLRAALAGLASDKLTFVDHVAGTATPDVAELPLSLIHI